MQAGELLSLIKNPGAIKKEDVARLERITAEFPYFQPAQLLLCLAASKWDAALYQQQLKRSAIAASSRSHLYDLIKKAEKEVLNAAPANTEDQALADIKPKLKDLSTEEELRIINASTTPQDLSKSNPPKALPSSMGEVLPDDFLEKEIQKQVTAAVVDKEIISTTHEPMEPPQEEASKPESPKEPGSFNDWLEMLKKPVELNQTPFTKKTKEIPQPQPQSQPQSQPEPPTEEALKAKRNKQKAIIDKIIEKSPGVIRPKEEQKFFTPERKAKESLLENEHLVTETLAKIYAMQGNISKAIRSYEILSLKYPQKSAYFASLIQKLKQNQ